MDLGTIIADDDVFVDLKPKSKRQLIQHLARKISVKLDVSDEIVFATIMQREKLGSTGVGNGVAIPHGKIEGIDKMSGMCVKLSKPISFDAIDDQPVDIVFLLLAPSEAGAEHLKALSKIARMLRDPDHLEKIRECQDNETLYSLITQVENNS